MKRKRKQFIAVILSGMMIFSTTGFAFADTEEETTQTEPVKIEKEVQQPTTVVEKPKQEEIQKEEEVKEENIKDTEKEENVTEIKAEEPKKINLSKNSEIKNEDPVELSITFKYIDRNTKEWTEYVITDSHDNRTIGVAKANNVIANHRTVTDGLVVKTFTSWDTEFPVVLNQSNPTVVVTAQYDIVKKPQLTFKYIDNISTGSGSWQNQSPTQSYTHTFKNPLVASPRTNYTFLYWENINDNSERYTVGQKYKCNSSTITEDTTVKFVAVYEYQPEVKVLYHYKNGIKDTGAKSKAIDIYADPQTPKFIKHWFYNEEDGNPIQKGELVALPEKLTPITTEPAAEDKVKIVDVYAHYHGVTFVDEDGRTILKDRVEYQYNTDATDIEKPNDPTKEATIQYTYFFNGWIPEITNIIEEVIYKATYRSEINKYTVTWKDWDNTLLEQDLEVPYGETPSYDGNEPKREKTAQYNYTFIGWSPIVKPVSGNITYVAQYEQDINKFKVLWQNWDKTILEEDLDVPYGDMPSYDGNTPTKVATSKYTYEFIEWSPKVETVTGDVIYQATFKAVLIPVPPKSDPDSDKPKVVNKTTTNETIVYYGMGDKIEYTPEPKSTTFPTTNTPLIAPTETGAWAFINLLAVLANFIICIFLLIMIFINNRKEDDETEVKNRILGRICTLIIAIVSGIIFLLTEDMSLPMVWVDQWTILMICTFVLQLIVGFLSKHKEEDKI